MSESLTYGLTSGGFVRMRLPEITRLLFDTLRERTGVVFDETPNSLMGQLVPIFAERLAEHWEREEQLFFTPYPATATDTSLDLAVSYSGVTRLQPSPTTARVVLHGTPGTVVPALSEMESSARGADGSSAPRFRLLEDVTISGANAALMAIEIPLSPTAGALYYVDWNGIRAAVVAATGENSAAVLLRLRDALIAVGASAAIVSGDLHVTSDGSFSGAVGPTLSISSIGSPGKAEAVVDGPYPLPALTLTTIRTPVNGWGSVYNPLDGVPGRRIEADDDLRSRYKLGVFRLGSGTVPAIRANLEQDISGLVSLSVFENTGDTTDLEGRPPHSVEVVIEGGDDQVIAERVFRLKPAGIAAYGNTLKQVLASDGYQHPIRFSRPEARDIWLKISLATTDEEPVPGDVQSRAIAAILAAGDKLQPGQNVFIQRLAAAAFPAASGIARVTITAVPTNPNAASPAAGAYGGNDIAIGARQRARFSLARVNVP